MDKGQVLLVVAAVIGLAAWLVVGANPDLIKWLGGTDPDSAAAVQVLAVMAAFFGSLVLFGTMAILGRRRRRHRRRRRL